MLYPGASGPLSPEVPLCTLLSSSFDFFPRYRPENILIMCFQTPHIHRLEKGSPLLGDEGAGAHLSSRRSSLTPSPGANSPVRAPPAPQAHGLHGHTVSKGTRSPRAHGLRGHWSPGVHGLRGHKGSTGTQSLRAHGLRGHTVSKGTQSPRARGLRGHTVSEDTRSPRARWQRPAIRAVQLLVLLSYCL